VVYCESDHSLESFESLVEEIARQGFDPETAGRYAVLIGDTPVIDSDGKLVVQDEHGKIIARLELLRGLGDYD